MAAIKEKAREEKQINMVNYAGIDLLTTMLYLAHKRRIHEDSKGKKIAVIMERKQQKLGFLEEIA